MQPASEQAVEVVRRECRWQFDDQLILRAAVQGEWRYYLADRAANLAWRLRVENDRITASVLCACLPDPPESRRSWPGL